MVTHVAIVLHNRLSAQHSRAREASVSVTLASVDLIVKEQNANTSHAYARKFTSDVGNGHASGVTSIPPHFFRIVILAILARNINLIGLLRHIDHRP